MLSKYPLLFKDPQIKYPELDSGTSFADYIAFNKKIIMSTRQDLENQPEKIITTNAPFEFLPLHNPIDKKIKFGALLIHGLLDSTFMMKDMALHLQSKGLLARSLLLPGHGTVPGGLLNVKYPQWLETVRFGITSLAKEVEQIFLIGFSTGAIASIYETLKDDAQIAGIIALAPVFRIKSHLACISNWPVILSNVCEKAAWMELEKEEDYAKYTSITYNSAYQVYLLTQQLKKLYQTKNLKCPLFFVSTQDDEIISSEAILDYFQKNKNPENRMIYYTNKPAEMEDTRITIRNSSFPEQRIVNFSHICLPISPDNPHYGINGDYYHANHVNTKKDCSYQAINKQQVKYYKKLYEMGLSKIWRKRLMFNPDFNFMMQQIDEFIFSKKTEHPKTT